MAAVIFVIFDIAAIAIIVVVVVIAVIGVIAVTVAAIIIATRVGIVATGAISIGATSNYLGSIVCFVSFISISPPLQLVSVFPSFVSKGVPSSSISFSFSSRASFSIRFS